MIKEIALADIDTMRAAIRNGVDRVELNSRLDLGGLTPDDQTVAEAVTLAAEAQIDLVVMIRPRGGDFDYSEVEIEDMRRSLRRMRALGVKTVTFGVVDVKKHLARDRMTKLLEAAKPMQVVYHMAFDDIAERCQQQTLRWLANYGVIRVLTHGGKLTVPLTETVSHLQEIVKMAPPGLTILPGGGVTFENAEWLSQQLHVNELHGSKIVPLPVEDAL